MVLRYELVCGQRLERIVPVDQVAAGHVLGEISVWCPACDLEQRVIRVHLDATR